MGRWLKAVEAAEQAPEVPIINEPATSKYEADTDPNVLLMAACYERWPDRVSEWLDVDWSNPVEVGVRVFGCRITRTAVAS